MTFYNDKPSINVDVEINASPFGEKVLVCNAGDHIGAKFWLQITKAGILFSYPVPQDKKNP